MMTCANPYTRADSGAWLFMSTPISLRGGLRESRILTKILSIISPFSCHGHGKESSSAALITFETSGTDGTSSQTFDRIPRIVETSGDRISEMDTLLASK